MRTAAELGGEITERDDTHVVAVLVAEERDRPVTDRLGVRLHGRRPVLVAQHLGVDQVLHLLLFIPGDDLRMEEVEPQPVRSDQRPGLAYVVAEHLAQGRVQQMRRGVVAHDGLPTKGVHGQLDRTSLAQYALGDVNHVNVTALGALGVGDPC